jgi:hypothetical protein
MLLVLAVVGSILVFDPPPLRLREQNEFVLSVTPPASSGARHPIEAGLACDHKLEGHVSGLLGRPQITFFDWLKRQSGNPSERDYHLSGRKPNDTWAVKVDRATNSFCYQTRSLIGAGLTDPHCGPKIIDENASRIVAAEQHVYDLISAMVFDKKAYTLTFTGLSIAFPGVATVAYLECH